MANKWMEGAGNDALEGTDNASLIDDNITAYIQDPLNRLLHEYIRGCLVEYASATTVTVSPGSCVAGDSTGTIHRMRQNTAAVTVDITSDLDTGSEDPSKTYYVWAVADADAVTFTCKLSESATVAGLTGITYAVLLGSVYNNSDGDFAPTTVRNSTPRQHPTVASWINPHSPYVYDSGWFAVTKGTNYTKTHGLNSVKLIYSIWGSVTGNDTDAVSVGWFAHSTTDSGAGIKELTSTTCVIQTQEDGCFVTVDDTGAEIHQDTGFLRVIMMAV